jgi:transcriptional regulator with PAS, ATPase and Fis domain
MVTARAAGGTVRAGSPRPGSPGGAGPEPGAGPGHELVGHSPAIRRLREVVRRVAPTRSSVLILGETGVGKEVVARSLHAQSGQRAGPFVAINCAAVPEHLIESEMFGCEAGAYTGASRPRAGWMEQADGGTLFLDELAEMPPRMQAKLLRVLQDGLVTRLGGERPRRVDVRLLAATAREPHADIAGGRLRADLYYRLCVVEIRVPPLRERKEDLLPLCRHFLGHELRKGSLRDVGVDAWEIFEAYPWPGNIRELQNVLRHGVALALAEDGPLLAPEHLPERMRGPVPDPVEGPSRPLDLAAAVRRVRSRYVTEALRRTDGNRSEAARLLGVSRRCLYDLLAEGEDP